MLLQARSAIAVLLTAGLAVLPGHARAQPAVDFAGRQLSIAIGYGTGGTYYAYAKLLAEHLGRFLPGKPGIIVQSMPGAGGVRLLNTAMRVMPTDGTQLFVPPDTMLIAQLTAKDGIQFDARRFRYVGTANQQNTFFAVRRTAASSIADVKAREVVVGHSGIGSAGHLIPALARETLGLKIKAIAGYEGSRDTLLAIERGEIDGGSFGWETWAQAVPKWFEGADKSFAVPLFQLGRAPDPDKPGVPLLATLVAPSDGALVNLFDTIGLIGRSLALPPATRDDIVEQHRKAMQAMLADREFQAEAARRKLRLMPLAGAELEAAILSAAGSADPGVLARARAMVER